MLLAQITAETRELILWVMGGSGTIVFTVMAFFVKRLVDQLDATRRGQHELRNDINRVRAAIDLKIERLRSAIKVGFERMKIRHDDLEGLHAEDDEPGGTERTR
jgi:hypothetical protein